MPRAVFSLLFLGLVAAWDSTLTASDVRVSLSPLAAQEWVDFLQDKVIDSVQSVETIIPHKNLFPQTLEELNVHVRERLANGARFFVVEPVAGLNFRQSIAQSWILSKLLGTTLAQNLDGQHLYVVHDRGGRMELGARYSQTSQGGSFHTDGVNVKPGYDIFLLSAVTSAYEGGDSILVDGAEVVKRLNATEAGREALATLSETWAWEWKGVRQGQYYSAPVLRIFTPEGSFRTNTTRYHWRYMRSYVEEAARRGGREGLTQAQRAAIDILDETLEDPALQWRAPLRPGETAIINDREIFHGRTAFADLCGAVTLDAFLATPVPEPRLVESIGIGGQTCNVELTDATRLMSAGHDASVRGSATENSGTVTVRRTYLRTWVDIADPIEWPVPSPRDDGYMDAFGDLEP